jgi:putative glutamine amidotransferase
VQITEDTLLARILGAPVVSVNSLHHQAARQVAAPLVPAAYSPDGVVEAVELPGHRFALGVQWHPEWLPGQPEMERLFRSFVESAR